MRLAGLASFIALSVVPVLVACSSDDDGSNTTPTPVSDGGTDGGLDLATACDLNVDAVYDNASPAGARGTVLKCAVDKTVTKEEIGATLAPLGYDTSRAFKSGAKLYRISYATARGDAAKTPAVSSALVLVPDTPRAAKLPIVVASRGSRGQAPKCAASKQDPALTGINEDYLRMVYGLVGEGYAVIAPDLAGYAGPPGAALSAYAQAADVARSTLDGAHALKALIPNLDSKVVLVGHSQGGHTALAALALSGAEGFDMPIVGAATWAPLWLSQRSWGAVLYQPVGKDYPLATSAVGNVSVWYHYTQAELLDGAGEGVKLFAADKQAAVKAFVENECWGSNALASSATYPSELFDPAFVSEVGFTSIGNNPCDPGTVCEKWLTRYSADRPHLTGAAATTPILVAYGKEDTTIPPERMRCAYDRLVQDGATFTFCGRTDATHGTIVAKTGFYVGDWIGQIALGEAAPAACETDQSILPATCATPPPND